MNCDFVDTGRVNANGVRLYQCSREGCRKGPWPSPSGVIRARCRAAGLGDAVAAVVKATLNIEPCGGCLDRKDRLNSLGRFASEAIARLHGKKLEGLGSPKPDPVIGLPPEKGIDL